MLAIGLQKSLWRYLESTCQYLSRKPGNAREFDSTWGDVTKLTKSQAVY